MTAKARDIKGKKVVYYIEMFFLSFLKRELPHTDHRVPRGEQQAPPDSSTAGTQESQAESET